MEQEYERQKTEMTQQFETGKSASKKPFERTNGDELAYEEYETQREFLEILRDTELNATAQTTLPFIKNPNNPERSKNILIEDFIRLFDEKIKKNPKIQDSINDQSQTQLHTKGIFYGFEIPQLITQCCKESNFPAAELWREIIRRNTKKISTKGLPQATKEEAGAIMLGEQFADEENHETFAAKLPESIQPFTESIEQGIHNNKSPETIVQEIEEKNGLVLSPEERIQTIQALSAWQSTEKLTEFAFQEKHVIAAAETGQLSSYQAYRQYLLSTSQGQALYTAAQKAEEVFVALLRQQKTAEEETAVDETTQAEQAYVQKKVENFAEIGVTIDQTSIKRDEETGEISAKVTYQETPYNIQIDPESKTIKIYDPLNRKAPLVAVHDITDESMVDGFIESYTLTILNLKKEWPQEKLTFIQGNELASFFTALFPKLQEGEKINLRKGPEANIMPNLIHLLVHEGNQNEAIKSLTRIARKNDPTFLRAIKRPEDEFKKDYPNLDSIKKGFLPEGDTI